MTPKVRGAWNLYGLVATRPLSFFVLFSSAASLLGSPGQANYAAANAFLDALSRFGAKANVPISSIQWGPFSDVGLAAADEKRGERLSLRGLEGMSVAQGFESLERLLSKRTIEAAVLRLNVERFRNAHPHIAEQPVWASLLAASAARTAPAGPKANMQARIRQADASERHALLVECMVSELAQVLRLDVSQVDAHASFLDMGVDSLMAVELRNRLQTSLGLRIPPTFLFVHPTPVVLAQYLLGQLFPGADEGRGS